MAYVLKLYDTPLTEFNMLSEGNNLLVDVLDVSDSSLALLPLDWHVQESNRDGLRHQVESSLKSWLKHRSIPANRVYVKSFLARLNLNENDIQGIVDLSHALSLNDSYWVDRSDQPSEFDEINLYDNRFSRAIAHMAFTGTGSYGIPGYSTSPEFTTNGTYAKCWRRQSGEVYLYKEGSVGAANSGGEPFAEYYAYNLARTLGIDAVEYAPTKWKGHFCSRCPLFTSKDIGFISAGRLVKSGGIDAVAEYYQHLGPQFQEAFADMLMFDALINNTDRHFGNFGVLINSRSNTIKAPAPLFDHGCSLFYQAMREDFDNLERYAATQTPRTYNGFVDQAARYLGRRQRQKLHHALEFRFKKHPRYNWPDWRLKALEGFIHKRASEMLEG